MYPKFFPKLKEKKYELLTFIVLLSFFSIIFFKYWVVSKNSLISTGELWQGIFALHIMRYGVLRYIITIPFLLVQRQGPVTAYLLIPSLSLFGQTAFALRLPRLIFLVLTSILTYFFAREFFNKRVAILTTLAFVLTPAFFANVQEHSLMPFFLILSLYTFNRFYKTRKIWYFYIFAFICGLGLLVRLSFLFYLISLFLTYKIAFKKMNNIIKYNHILVALIFFVLGSYPLLLFNLGGSIDNKLYIENNFYGVTPRYGSLRTIKFGLNNFPKTNDGVNLLDVGTNLRKGFIESLPAVLIGDRYYLQQPPSFFLPLFLGSLILISTSVIYNWYNWSKYNWLEKEIRFVSKDLFLLSNFLIISFFISTVTISSFRVVEFTMLFPIFTLIVGRAFSEVLKIKTRSEVLFCVCAFFMIYLLTFSTYEFFKYFIEGRANVDEISCVPIGADIVEFILNSNYTTVYVSDHGSIMNFNWHMYKTGIHDKKFYIFFGPDPPVFKEDSLYVLAGEKCLDNKDRTIEKVLEIADDYNKKAILEDSFYLESGDLGYVIYRFI